MKFPNLTIRQRRLRIGIRPLTSVVMKQSDIFRDNAENCLQLAEQAEGQPAYKRYSRMAEAWAALAEEQDWLDGEIPPVTARTPRNKTAA